MSHPSKEPSLQEQLVKAKDELGWAMAKVRDLKERIKGDRVERHVRRLKYERSKS